ILTTESLSADEAAVTRLIVGMLSEKTGYPPEVLATDLDLEGELGIDTVKQVEVLGQIYARYGLPVPEGVALAELNTIGKVAHSLAQRLRATTDTADAPVALTETPTTEIASFPRHSLFRPRLENLLPARSPLALEGGSVVAISGVRCLGLAEDVAE